MTRSSIEGVTLHGPGLFGDVAFRLQEGVDVFYEDQASQDDLGAVQPV